jgi:hypothetical protein
MGPGAEAGTTLCLLLGCERLGTAGSLYGFEKVPIKPVAPLA